ncbi:MAG: hypothetical protein JW719_01700 [Pirellulales bacterium]|nr:hypothetical protein [Pirellulales bacterium]
MNFSAGAPDAAFLRALNECFGEIEPKDSRGRAVADSQPAPKPAWRQLAGQLREGLDRLRGRSKAFEHVEQAEAAIRLVFEETLPAYQRFHRDLLFHQDETTLFRPFFIGRVCEAVLAEGRPWDETDRIVAGAITRLNDFLGHRPIAVLRDGRKVQPYEHERVRPIPLWIRDVGAAAGPYRELIETTVAILRETDPDLLARSWFDPELLDELAVDPRAYDFDHPVHRRPNYQFGQWDPSHIDGRGYYRRYVLQQVTLDGILGRVMDRGRLGRKEVLYEQAAVLAGTILMGSGISGDGPGRHSSDVTLATLLAHIAEYRDDFYAWFFSGMTGKHWQRLKAEAERLHQPLGAARQHLNQFLAARRASQLQHVHLSQLYARMGYPDAAMAQARIVPVASARMHCEIQCRLTAAHHHVDRREFEAAAALLSEIEDTLHRAIECGALVDPWNVLGFEAMFSLFPALENSCHDHRVDELLDVMDDVFSLYARVEKAAAAAGRKDILSRLSVSLEALAAWWDRFATAEVSSVEGISGREAYESASHVATVLGLWHEAGTAAGDVAFWRRHVDNFQSAKAYALVVEALLDERDLVAAMGLLMQWLGESDRTPLVEGKYSFHQLALRWMRMLWTSETGPKDRAADDVESRWAQTRKFFDYLEAGGESYWAVPRLELATHGAAPMQEEDDEPEDPDAWLYEAAYENVVYRDSADDGFEGEVFEPGAGMDDFELTSEAERISKRLAFLRMLARLWRIAAGEVVHARGEANAGILSDWLSRAERNYNDLLELLESVHRYRIATPSGTEDSLLEYDHRQSVKEMMLDRITVTAIETADAARTIAIIGRNPAEDDERQPWETLVERALRAGYARQTRPIRQLWPRLMDDLSDRPLLYLPLARGGSPRKLITARCLHRAIGDLLVMLPRLGLFTEACQLLAIVQWMERENPVGPGGVTEFDRIFTTGFKALMTCMVAAAESDHLTDDELIECLEETSEPLVRLWLRHCRGVRFSPLEAVGEEPRWDELKRFIREYGAGLFTQHFMNFGNLRAILYEGIDAYLRWLEENADAEDHGRLVTNLGRRLPRDRAIRLLTITIEAVLDNYNEYMDYNSTTTQSDRGEMLYTLLDFLRLTTSYDRVAWNLQPLVLAHDVLIRSGRIEAAALWRETFAEQTGPLAEDHLRKMRSLAREYGMQLRSVCDRLGQRFVRPLDNDRLRALVGPAVEQARNAAQPVAFAQLEREINALTEEPSGAGFVVPEWLESLEDEAERHRTDGRAIEEDVEPEDEPYNGPRIKLTLETIRRQVLDWSGEIDLFD